MELNDITSFSFQKNVHLGGGGGTYLSHVCENRADEAGRSGSLACILVTCLAARAMLDMDLGRAESTTREDHESLVNPM